MEVEAVREWWSTIAANRPRVSRFGRFWLLMCAVTACAWFIPRLSETAGSVIPLFTAVLAAAGAGVTAGSIKLNTAVAGGLVMTGHMLFQSACRAVYQRVYPLAVIRGGHLSHSPGWQGAMAEVMLVVVLTFILGAAAGFLAARFWPSKRKV